VAFCSHVRQTLFPTRYALAHRVLFLKKIFVWRKEIPRVKVAIYKQSYVTRADVMVPSFVPDKKFNCHEVRK
jgi:hypothetical protein